MQAIVFRAPKSHSVSELMDQLVSVTRFGPGGRAVGDQVEHAVTSEPVWENPFLRGF